MEKLFAALGVSGREMEGVGAPALLGFLAWALSPREVAVVRAYYGIGCRKRSAEAIGRQLGLTKGGVTAIRDGALRTLRRPWRRGVLASIAEEERWLKESLDLRRSRARVHTLEKRLANARRRAVALSELAPRFAKAAHDLPRAVEKRTKELELSPQPLDELGLTIRVIHVLEAGGIFTIGELLITSQEKLLRMYGMGPETIREIKEALATHGLCLASSAP